MTTQEMPMTVRVRNGEPQALRTGDNNSPATAIGSVARTIHTAKRKFQSLEIAAANGAKRPQHDAAHVGPEIADDGGERRDLHRGRKRRSRILPAEESRDDPHMRRGGNRQQLGNALNDAEKANLGVAESDKAGIEPFGAGCGHD